MGGMYKNLVRRITHQKDEDVMAHARQQHEAIVTQAKEQPFAEQKQKRLVRYEVDPDDDQAVWFMNITDVCNRQCQLEKHAASVRVEIEKWEKVYEAHVAGAEKVRVFDWRENDAKYKRIISHLQEDLKYDLEHINYLRLEYDELKARQFEIFGKPHRLPHEEVFKKAPRKPLDLDA